MKLIYALTISLATLVPLSSYAEDSQYCKEPYLKKVEVLFQNRNIETAKVFFQILSCNELISTAALKDQFIATIGGYMRENPNLIEPLLISANAASNSDAAKIYLDGLWFCASKECRNKLKARPFQISIDDVTNLLKESPPDPFSIPLTNPATLDLLWAYFFGTGDLRIVVRVFNLLSDNWEELNSSTSMKIERRMFLSSARWSLVSIAKHHELVRNFLEKNKSHVAQELLKQVNKK